MSKVYEKMRHGENLGWCRPYVNGDETKAVAINEGKAVAAKGLLDVDGNTSAEEIFERYPELRETGCANCPWKDACEAMDET